MAVNCFDVDAILGQIAEKMSISEDEVQTTIDEFEASPRIAKMAFDSWNAARLAKS